MTEADGRSHGSGLKHPTVLAGLVTAIGAVVAALIASPPHLGGFVDRLFNMPTHITYTVEYKNAGDAAQGGIHLAVALPDGVEYIPKTTYYRAIDSNGDWKSIGDGITGSGLNF